jgi:hypothetical protein
MTGTVLSPAMLQLLTMRIEQISVQTASVATSRVTEAQTGVHILMNILGGRTEKVMAVN